ncbi:MAG: hypothetical protein QM805_00685 [Pseudomonas sp.]
MPRAEVQDHDERRQPRSRLRLRQAAERGRGPGASGIHHQPHDRRAPEGAAELQDAAARRKQSSIDRRIAGYAEPVDFYVEKLIEGVATIAAAFWPKKVIVRMSDFKSNEYANLIGGGSVRAARRKPDAGLPWRLALHLRQSFRDCFDLECRALKKVRDDMGLTNVEIMVPFVRTPWARPSGHRAAGRQGP